MHINPIVIIILLGLLAVVLIATVGAAASRKFNFNYSKLSLVSLVVYIALGYLIARYADLAAILLATNVVGLFDATIAWNLCLRFNARISDEEQESLKVPTSVRVILMMVIASACGYVGYLLSGR